MKTREAFVAANPRVLAALMKTQLEVGDGRRGGLGGRVRAAADPELISAIEKSSRVSWLPLAQHVALTEILFEVAGRREAREVCRQTIVASFEQPYLRPLFDGAIRILGREFGRFVKWTPKAWSALFRDAGDIHWIAEGDDRGRLVLHGAARAITGSDAYVEGLAGAFEALLDVTDNQGEVRVTAAKDRIDFAFRW